MPVTLDQSFLPAVPASGFGLGGREALPEGMRRMSVDQFDRSIGRLSAGDDIDRAVHEVRKSMKRLRALLRLARSQIGNRVYRAENALLRETARRLAPMRDGYVMLETLRHLRTDFAGQLSSDALTDTEQRLERRHLQRRARILDDARVIPDVTATLRAARNRYASWPVNGQDAALDLYGRAPLDDSFSAIRSGLHQTYGRGRSEMRLAEARPSPEHFHEWRKRVKYLRHQTEILAPVWPEVMGGYAASLDTLGERLGGEHDLAALLRLVTEVPDLAPDPGERTMLAALAQHRRRSLQAASLTLGSRIYAESPDRFVNRIEGFWDARMRELRA